jgi:DNA-binding NtrC family response regulator
MILIIDDDAGVRGSLMVLFKQNSLKAKAVTCPKEAFPVLETETVWLIILDMNFTIETSGDEGLAALAQLKSHWPAIPVILLTGWGHMALAIDGMKAGASDFINKPWDNDYLIRCVQNLLQHDNNDKAPKNRAMLDKKYNFDMIVGQNTQLFSVLQNVGRVAATDAPVLILGESGTGKELIAEAIHLNSKRSKKPFVKVNLGGISTSLFESEMFGHKKGAFTDAYMDRCGRFELAEGGTIFLDEIGDLDLSSQVKLLRVLQDRKFEVLGSSLTRTSDVRVICATNKNLQEMVQQGLFREDLFYRINLITVYLPALRERKDDIPLLVNFFLNNLKKLYQRPTLNISPKAMEWLKNYPFKGNIRQLKNLVESTILLSDKDELGAEEFQIHAEISSPMQARLPADLEIMPLEDMEIKLIQKAMALYNNKIQRAAQILGLSRNALYRRLEKYNIPYED